MLFERTYHVIRRRDDEWQVVREGFHRPHFVRDNKDEAVLLAKRLAKTQCDARVVVHNGENDGVESEFRYYASSC